MGRVRQIARGLHRAMGSLRQVLAQLHGEGLNAKIVDAIDGDAFTSQARLVLNFSKLSRCAARRTNSCYRVVLQSMRLARRKLRSCFAAVAFESNISEKTETQSSRHAGVCNPFGFVPAQVQLAWGQIPQPFHVGRG